MAPTRRRLKQTVVYGVAIAAHKMRNLAFGENRIHQLRKNLVVQYDNLFETFHVYLHHCRVRGG